MTYKEPQEKDVSRWKPAPLRPLDDFLLGSARFDWPDTTVPGKWGKRVKKNLLYYQSNYFLSMIILFIVIACFKTTVILALASIAFGVLSYDLISKNKTWVIQLQQEYPAGGWALLIFSLYLAVTLAHNLPALLVVIALCLSVVFIHASLRLRNIRNKLFYEGAKLQNSPMFIILNEIFKFEVVADSMRSTNSNDDG